MGGQRRDGDSTSRRLLLAGVPAAQSGRRLRRPGDRPSRRLLLAVAVLIGGIVPLVVPISPAFAGVPVGWTDLQAVNYTCDSDQTGNLVPTADCVETGTSDPIVLTSGTAGLRFSLRDEGAVYGFATHAIGGGTTGAAAPFLWCAWNPYHSGGADWAWKYESAGGSVSGSTAQAFGGDQEIGDGSTWGGPYEGYLFLVDDPATNYATEWAIGINATCAAADPGAPPTGPAIVPVIETVGVPEPGQEIAIELIAPDHDGEDVTCTVQSSLTNPYTGTVASGEFAIEAAFVFEVNGIFVIGCEADDGEFDGTDPAVEFVSARLVIGSGVDDALGGCEFDPSIGGVIAGLSDYENCLIAYGGGCGAWYNIACHFGSALRWAFVPDPAVIDALYEDASDEFPFSVGFEFFEILGVVEDALEVEADSPGISFDIEVNGETLGVDFLFPCVYDTGDTPCSPGSVLTVDGQAVGDWAIPGDESAGVTDLWGYRTILRNVLLVGLYMGWAFGLFKWAERKLEGGGS